MMNHERMNETCDMIDCKSVCSLLGSLTFCFKCWVHVEGRGGLLLGRVYDNGEGSHHHDVLL